MQEEARRNARSNEQRAAIKNVGREQLLSWGILAEKDGVALATNAYAILTGNAAVPPAMIQCGVFKGKTRAVFVDRREYGGPIWEQIEQAYQLFCAIFIWVQNLMACTGRMCTRFRRRQFVS